jgi:YD repeat-containing protein
MRVGHNRWKAARTLAGTLGNRACWHAFGPGPGNDFLRVNMFGVWFAIEDVPGWTRFFWQDGHTYLSVEDPCASVEYDFFTTDTGETPGAITWEDYMFNEDTRMLGVWDAAQSQPQRVFTYQSDNITQNLISQCDIEGMSTDNCITYDYTPQGAQLQLNVTGHDAASGATRQVQTTFDPEIVPGDAGTRPLVQATVPGDGASRIYEWYPVSDPPTQRDRKLKKVSDTAGQVLAEYAYDDHGRLISHTRGSAAMGKRQTVADFLYEEPDDPEDTYIMEARFWVDESNHQVAVRTFDKAYHVVGLAEYHDLVSNTARACCMSDQSCQDLSREACLAQDGTPQHPGSACDGFDCTDPPTGDASVTAFDYHIPDDDVDPGEHDPFYHQVCTINSEQVVLTRCVEKTAPKGDMSEYNFFDCDFNAVESYMGPPDITGTPSQPKSHVTRAYDRQTGWGVTQITQECDVSRNACADMTYDTDGFLTRRDEPQVTVGVNTGFRAYRTIHYDSKHRVDYETRNDGTGAAITIDYGYDAYDYVNRRTENPGADEIEQLFVNNAFGQETQRTDPDGYVHAQESNSAGLLAKTYTYSSGSSGPVIKQSNYTYTDGRLSTVQEADHDGPFAKDSPSAWVTTTYQYDDYGRVTSKTINPGGHTTTYQYDIQDRITKITYPDGIWKETVRDGRGLIVETRIGPNPVLVSTYEYDLNGNLARRTCQGCPDCAHETVYEHDEYNRRTAEIRKD